MLSRVIAHIQGEPAVYVGLVVSVVVIAAQQLLTSGIVTSEKGVNWLNFVIAVSPLIAGALTRGRVSPAE